MRWDPTGQIRSAARDHKSCGQNQLINLATVGWAGNAPASATFDDTAAYGTIDYL